MPLNVLNHSSLISMTKQQFAPLIDENRYLNTTHKVNLTGSEISTILYYLDEVQEEIGIVGKSLPIVERIYAELQSVTDNYYAQLEEGN